MRVIKENTSVYETFYESLNFMEQPASGTQVHQPVASPKSGDDNYFYFYNLLYNCQTKLHEAKNVDEATNILLTGLKKVVGYKSAGIMIIDEFNNCLRTLTRKFDDRCISYLNQIYKTEIIDWIFEKKDACVIPDMNSESVSEKQKLFYLLVPIFEAGKRKGFLAVYTPRKDYEDNSAEVQTMRLLTSMVVSRLELLKRRKDLKKAYSELQAYQSKISNDSGLTAVGELTTSVFENILAPLQTIMSYADLLQMEDDSSIQHSSMTIKNQVKKIEGVIERIEKFSRTNGSPAKIKLGSCNINTLISKYYDVVNNSFQSKNYEVILDLDDNLPPVLSNPQYINHALSNVVSIIRSPKSDSGGILLQTRYSSDEVVVRFYSTDYIPAINGADPEEETQEIRILRNIMRKHEGIVETSTDRSRGSSILLRFPLKRKVRK